MQLATVSMKRLTVLIGCGDVLQEEHLLGRDAWRKKSWVFLWYREFVFPDPEKYLVILFNVFPRKFHGSTWLANIQWWLLMVGPLARPSGNVVVVGASPWDGQMQLVRCRGSITVPTQLNYRPRY